MGGMESLGFPHVLGPALSWGPVGIILILWYFGDKARERDLKCYREDTQKILKAYQEDMVAIRQMYEDNVKLVKAHLEISGALKDIVTLNTAKWQEAHDKIVGNQFCPNVRLEKKAHGVQT